jgi:transposase
LGDVVHPRCAGIDCSKKDAKVCIRVQGQGRGRASSTVTTWGATTSQILALREHLIAEKVTYVVIELTVLLSARRRAEHDAGQRIAGT